MDTREAEKADAARKSLDFVEDGMVVGLGTGTTAKYAIKFLGERVHEGLKIRGIPTRMRVPNLPVWQGFRSSPLRMRPSWM
jgi:ribose 5-phosphate isomerase A